MQKNRTQALVWIDDDEGPELNVSPDEPGGCSCRGVTMEVMREYCIAHNLSPPLIPAELQTMVSGDMAGKVFGWRYLDPLRFDELPTGVDYRLADMAISLGSNGVIAVVQMCLCIWPLTESNVMDDHTMTMIKATTPAVLILQLDAAWLVWKSKLTPNGWSKYGHGWTNRVLKVRARLPSLMGAGA